MTTTREERKTASEMEWVTKTTVVRTSVQMRSSSPWRRSRFISSRAPSGSSMKRMEGSAERARAMATRCCMPPESCHGKCFANSPRRTSSSISSALARRWSFGAPATWSGSSTLRWTLRQSKSPACWKTMP
nr:hypothetical protein [Streptomyces sp. SM12]